MQHLRIATPLSSRQVNIDQRNLRQFLNHLPWFIPTRRDDRVAPNSSTTRRPGRTGECAPRRASVCCPRSAEVLGSISECEILPRPRLAECRPVRVLPDPSPPHCCAAGSSPRSTVPTVASGRFSSSRTSPIRWHLPRSRPGRLRLPRSPDSIVTPHVGPRQPAIASASNNRHRFSPAPPGCASRSDHA
jgi:hypothetical protein